MNMKILNVGCGDDTYGTEFIDLYPARFEVIKCDVDKEKFPFKNNTFDEVYAKNILEHSSNIAHLFNEAKRVLKPRGKLVIITDNAGYWNFHMSFSKLHHLPLGKAGHGSEDKHFALFTPQHLKNLFERFGFKVMKIEKFNQTAKWETPINFFLSKIWLFKKMSYQKIKIGGRKQ
jgi:ubiquinone/menaquinone biosynthesis C-methylase UbiE